MTALLDGNVLVALSSPGHVHHEAAHSWWEGRSGETFATCPITQGALLRIALVRGKPVGDALHQLRRLTSHQAHDFWVDDLGYLDADLSRVSGHRQVTDAYLAALARHHGGHLATFDKGLAALHPDVAELLPG